VEVKGGKLEQALNGTWNRKSGQTSLWNVRFGKLKLEWLPKIGNGDLHFVYLLVMNLLL
jgi:hypothetical protein